MAQNRVKSGNDFEKSVCERLNWTRRSKSPKIKWSGTGKSNFRKIESVDFDPDRFFPSGDSDFRKFDAITLKDEKVEIKKYSKSDLNKWILYSEPMFKVSDWKSLAKAINIFGNDGSERDLRLKDAYPQCPEKHSNHRLTGDPDLAIRRYNGFVSGLSKSDVCKDILEKITGSNIGIQLEDGFVSQSELEYRWTISNDWCGFNRLKIEFRLKG